MVEADALNGSDKTNDDISFLVTTQPPRDVGATKKDEPDGWTERIVTPKVKDIILRIPNFPKRPKHPADSRYRIGTASIGTGLGMFATKNIRAGDMIMCERPFVIASSNIGRGMLMPEGMSREEAIQGILANVELRYEATIRRLLPKDQAAYKALYNCHLHDGSGPLLGIFRTNSLQATELVDPDEPEYAGYAGVCKDMSRINHRQVISAICSRPFEILTIDLQLCSQRRLVVRPPVFRFRAHGKVGYQEGRRDHNHVLRDQYPHERATGAVSTIRLQMLLSKVRRPISRVSF